MNNNQVDAATKYQIESNNKYADFSKQSSDKGTNTTESIIKIIQQQADNKESE